MSGDDRDEKKVDARQRGDVGGGGANRLKAVTSGGAVNSAIDAGGEASVRTGDEEGGRGLLLLGDGAKVGGAEMHRAESASGLDQLHQFGVAAEKPLGTEGTRQSRLEGEMGAKGIEVEDGGARGGNRRKR